MKHLPKLELHLHIEGAAPPDLIREIAARKSVDLSSVFAADGGYDFADFWQFLQVYEAATSVLTTPEDYHGLTERVLSESHDKGVVYTELFISPDFCGGRDLSAWRDYLWAIEDAARQAEARSGIITRGIVTCIRHFGPDKARETALCAAETAGGFITGFGMGGDEKAGRQGDFAWAFDCAREAGLGLTSHAGEWDGPASVRAALNDLRVDRIGHGVRAVEDPALVADLVAHGVMLEVCPGSNVALGLCDWSAHPIERLRAAGVKVCVSTDDPPFFRTDMGHEYQRLADTFGWDEARFTQLNRDAAQAAFCDQATRARVLKRLEPEP